MKKVFSALIALLVITSATFGTNLSAKTVQKNTSNTICTAGCTTASASLHAPPLLPDKNIVANKAKNVMGDKEGIAAVSNIESGGTLAAINSAGNNTAKDVGINIAIYNSLGGTTNTSTISANAVPTVTASPPNSFMMINNQSTYQAKANNTGQVAAIKEKKTSTPHGSGCTCATCATNNSTGDGNTTYTIRI